MPYMLELAAIIAIAVEDYIDFAIIMAILIVNGYLGFHEELKSKASLDELTNKMEQKIAVLRDGVAENLLTRLLVPGDVVLMVGGCATPADVEWIEGKVSNELQFRHRHHLLCSRILPQVIYCQLIQPQSRENHYHVTILASNTEPLFLLEQL